MDDILERQKTNWREFVAQHLIKNNYIQTKHLMATNIAGNDISIKSDALTSFLQVTSAFSK